MDKEVFVENIEFLLKSKGLKKGAVFEELGLSKNYLFDISRGRKIDLEGTCSLAAYLGVTTSRLLGEDEPPGVGAGGSSADQELLDAYHRADQDTQQIVALALKPFKQEGQEENVV